VGVGLAGQDAGVVDEELGGEIVGAVDDEVIAGNDGGNIGRTDPLLVSVDRHIRIDGAHLFGGGNYLRFADIRGEMDHLPLQVGDIDNVGIGNADGAYAGGRQIEGDRRAETAGADDQHPAVKQLALPFAADFLENDMARIALDLFFVEHHLPPPMKYKNSTVSPSATVVLSKAGRSRISPLSSTVT